MSGGDGEKAGGGGAMPRSRAEFLRRLEEHRKDYLRSLPAQVERLETLWAEATASPQPAPLIGELERLAHTLHGTGGTFGLPELARAAESLEQECAALAGGNRIPDRAAQHRIAAAIAAVRSSVPRS